MNQRQSHIPATLIGSGIVFVISIWQIWGQTPAASLALEKTGQFVLGETTEQTLLSQIAPPETFPYVVDAGQPLVKSKSAVVYDPDSKTFLYIMQGDTELPVASLMKIVTALVAEQEYELDARIQVPQSVYSVDGSRVHLVAGEVLSVREMLAAALIPSGNDAAYTLAAIHPEGYDTFIKKMNDFVTQNNLTHTRINNPVGYDFNNQYSSASDIAVLSARLLESPTLSEIVQTKRMSLGGEKKTYSLVNTNKLLFTHGEVTGLKTGTSEVAGENLVFSWVHDNRTLVGVVLGSSQRFVDAEILMRWIDRAYIW